MTYAKSGVDYSRLDPFKRDATTAAMQTDRGSPLKRLGFRPIRETRGESAFGLWPLRKDFYRLFHVEEGLGTKNLIADAVYASSDDASVYRSVSQDTIAMIINDMATLGAFPLSLQMHLAVGSSDWFKDERRSRALIEGWRDACVEARCVWAGGETPALKGLVVPESFLLSGSAVGVTKKGHRRLAAENIKEGDAIMIAAASGVHANGLTLCREIASHLPAKFQTLLNPSQFGTIVGGPPSYGRALLTPTPLYSVLVEDLLDAGVNVRYCVNITGHGWRKFMRAPQPWLYDITDLPTQPPIFNFIQEKGKVADKEMFGSYNMGAGFGFYIDPKDEDKAERVGKRFKLLRAGTVKQSPDGRKRVVIGGNFLEFVDEDLAVGR